MSREPDLETLPAINADLDERIAPLVHALRRDGFATFGSCDNHGREHGQPWVQIEWPVINARKCGDELMRWFSDRGVYVNICLITGNYGRHEDSEEPTRFIRVEVFDDLIREAFAW